MMALRLFLDFLLKLLPNFCIRHPAPQQTPQIQGLPVLETGLKSTVRGQPHPVALSAEFMGNGADEADLSPKSRKLIIMGRPIAHVPIIRAKNTILLLQQPQNLLFRNSILVPSLADGHQFDEPHCQRIILCQSCDGGHFIQIE